MEYVKLGTIVNTRGLKGELKIRSCSDFDEVRYRKGNEVFILYEGEYLPFITDGYHEMKGFSYIFLKDCRDINLVEKYKGCDIFCDAAKRDPLEEGEYYRSDLIGCEVYGQDGARIGTCIAVEETAGANNNLRIDTGEKQILVPNVKAFVKEVDIREKKIRIEVIGGLL